MPSIHHLHWYFSSAAEGRRFDAARARRHGPLRESAHRQRGATCIAASLAFERTLCARCPIVFNDCSAFSRLQDSTDQCGCGGPADPRPSRRSRGVAAAGSRLLPADPGALEERRAGEPPPSAPPRLGELVPGAAGVARHARRHNLPVLSGFHNLAGVPGIWRAHGRARLWLLGPGGPLVSPAPMPDCARSRRF